MTYETTAYYITKTQNSIIRTLFHNILVCFPPVLKRGKMLTMHLNSNQLDKNVIQINS